VPAEGCRRHLSAFYQVKNCPHMGLGNVFPFKRDFEDYFLGARSNDFAESLKLSLRNFKMLLSQNKKAIH
jgi:hypothetical protein